MRRLLVLIPLLLVACQQVPTPPATPSIRTISSTTEYEISLKKDIVFVESKPGCYKKKVIWTASPPSPDITYYYGTNQCANRNGQPIPCQTPIPPPVYQSESLNTVITKVLNNEEGKDN